MSSTEGGLPGSTDDFEFTSVDVRPVALPSFEVLPVRGETLLYTVSTDKTNIGKPVLNQCSGVDQRSL